MASSVTDILTPSVVTGIISRVNAPGSPLQQYFGMEIGGPNTNQVSGRSYSFDIMDHVYTIAQGRAPGTGPSIIAANAVGKKTGTFARSYEKIPLLYETLANIRSLGENAGVRDKMGVKYVEGQARFLKERANNFREIQLAGLLTQGKYYLKMDGDNWSPTLSSSGTVLTVDYQIPAAHISTAIAGLDPLGTGNIITATWATASNDIPLMIDNINIAFQTLRQGMLGLVITDTTVWRYVLSNTKVQAQAGSVNRPYVDFELTPLLGADGKKLGIMRGKIASHPWLEWLIIDTGLDPLGTAAKFYDGTKATFMAVPDGSWLKMQEGSEPVKDNPAAPALERYGTYAWVREWDEPAQMQLCMLQNCIVECNRPKSIMIAKVA